MIPEPVQGITQPNRINLPAPVGFLHIRVRNQAFAFVVVQLRVIWRRFSGERHVIAETDIIHTALLQRSKIVGCDVQLKAATFKVVEQVLRVFSTDMHIGEPVAPVHGVHRHHDVVRRAA
ncbi:hypothetical protein D3C78_1213430 [compost metagenome]